MESVINNNGIRVNKICASCKFRSLDSHHRRCELDNKAVSACQTCDRWVISEGMKNVGGRNGGKIKKRKYLLYAIMKLRHNGESVEKARSEYSKTNGTIFEF